VLLTAIAALLPGCSRKVDAQSELERATREMQQAGQSAPVAQPATTPPGTRAQTPAVPAEQMNQAMTSYKAGNYEDAVTRLQQLRATPVMTPQQRMALQDAIAAVMADIAVMAEKGDPRAIQALRRYRSMQNKPR